MDAYFDLSWNIAPHSLPSRHRRLNVFLSIFSAVFSRRIASIFIYMILE